MRFFRSKVTNFFIILILVSLVAPGTSGLVSCKFKTVERFEETREMMGTYVNIIIYADADSAPEVMEAACARIEEIENIATIYDENSEASTLNSQGYIDDPSKELLELIELATYYYDISSGSFDITISPVLGLWREGLWKESEEVQAEKIEETLKLVGSDKIIVEEGKIYFELEGMSIDLGGIAKGYSVDEALEVISGYGIKHALVNAGGDLGTIGMKPDGEKWLVELENPDDPDNENTGVEALPNFVFEGKAVATSGNYYRYYDPEKEVHHITDPATGYSANKCISVTVIAGSCTEADALATSVFVKGPVEGLKLIEELEDVEALIIDNDRNVYQSTGLSEYMK